MSEETNITIPPLGAKPMPKEIAEAVTKVMARVDYVEKKGENTFHHYKFAAVGDLLAKIQPAMAEAGLSLVQNEVKFSFPNNGEFTLATYEFILSHASGVTWEERPKITGMAAGRNSKGGMDDKALNKCHTAARKYFLLSLFQVPTGEDADPDAQEDVPPPPQQRGRPNQQGSQRGPQGQQGRQQSRQNGPAGGRQQRQEDPPESEPEHRRQTANIPLVYTDTNETTYFKTAGEWLDAWSAFFDQAPDLDAKGAFHDANLQTFQHLQSRVQNNKSAADAFAEAADRAFNELNG
jgi:hypothetical protein